MEVEKILGVYLVELLSLKGVPRGTRSVPRGTRSVPRGTFQMLKHISKVMLQRITEIEKIV